MRTRVLGSESRIFSPHCAMALLLREHLVISRLAYCQLFCQLILLALLSLQYDGSPKIRLRPDLGRRYNIKSEIRPVYFTPEEVAPAGGAPRGAWWQKREQVVF